MALSARVPDLAALEVLLSVARTGSLGRAAQEAGVSQQAVSARVRAMEAQTGVTLVQRTARGSSLTAEGAVIAEWAARVLDVAGELDAEIAALRKDLRSRLRLCASLTIAERLMPAWLVSYRTAARDRGRQDVEIILTASNTNGVITNVTDGACDLGFIESPRAPRSLRSRVIGHDRLVVVAPPGHPWARRRRPVGAAELAATPLVSREDGSGTAQTLTGALTAAIGADVVRAQPALSVSTTAAARAAVLAGAAPSAITELAVADDLAAGRLIRIEIPELDLNRALRAIWNGSASPPAGPARDLITHILSLRRKPVPRPRPVTG
ncbi:MAG TPA: LysR family transcriptional regulator [Trebonia sp.]|jgi:molybdate transport repressor ModE-like protein|nr:LysR family transcriptional regulator [Trebonia sp.]